MALKNWVLVKKYQHVLGDPFAESYFKKGRSKSF